MQSEQWTQIISKGKRRKGEDRLPVMKPTNPPSQSVTLEKMQSDFNGKMRTWQACDCRRSVLSILDRVQPSGGWDIRRAVCVGSGSFSRDNMECRKRSVWQFVVFVDLAGELQKRSKSGIDMEMYAQEPEFTELDKALLSRLGIKELEVRRLVSEPHEVSDLANLGFGAAKTRMDKSAFLYEPFMDLTAEMAKQILDSKLALYIGSSMRGLLTKPGQAGDLARCFDREHDQYHFPPFDHDPNVLEGLGIHWRPEIDDGI